ncbi:MAG: ParA family protein [Lachnospiraceae bacterium]|nr:ParA family protein [Lachnospiraceae bacterium]
MGRIIALTNQKGGVGKTTTAINLSAALGEAGQHVLLIDFDPQGNATTGMMKERLDPTLPTVYELLCGLADARDCIIEGVAAGVDLMPASVSLSGAEVELLELDSIETKTQLRDSIAGLRDMYDYILIDRPPSIGILTINALTASDGAIIPVQCEFYALEGLRQVIETIRLIQTKLNPDLVIEGILMTMYNSRTRLSIQVVDTVRDTVKKELNEHVFETMIPRNVRLAEAPSFGEPITVYDSASRGADSYRLLAAELLEKN